MNFLESPPFRPFSIFPTPSAFQHAWQYTTVLPAIQEYCLSFTIIYVIYVGLVKSGCAPWVLPARAAVTSGDATYLITLSQKSLCVFMPEDATEVVIVVFLSDFSVFYCILIEFLYFVLSVGWNGFVADFNINFIIFVESCCVGSETLADFRPEAGGEEHHHQRTPGTGAKWCGASESVITSPVGFPEIKFSASTYITTFHLTQLLGR